MARLVKTEESRLNLHTERSSNDGGSERAAIDKGPNIELSLRPRPDSGNKAADPWRPEPGGGRERGRRRPGRVLLPFLSAGPHRNEKPPPPHYPLSAVHRNRCRHTWRCHIATNPRGEEVVDSAGKGPTHPAKPACSRIHCRQSRRPGPEAVFLSDSQL